MESVAKAIEACGATFEEFSSLVSSAGNNTQYTQPIPLIGFAQAGVGGFFDDGGFPVGGGWEHVRFPEVRDESAYGLEVSGDSMEPLYRDGDILIVSPHSEVRRGDRVVVKTSEGEVMAKELVRKTASRVELASMNPEHATLVYKPLQLEWMARIVWVSQ
jgi:phage repressor protein C with HTH and peptisase S24 domain